MSTMWSKSESDSLLGPSIAIFIRLPRFVSVSLFRSLVFIVFIAEKLRFMEAVLTGRRHQFHHIRKYNVAACRLGFEGLQ